VSARPDELPASQSYPPAPDLAAMLDVRPLGDDVFAAGNPSMPDRRNLFGGQVAAHALRAAAATVGPDRHPHSLHAYFLREGLVSQDLEMSVTRTREGRSFSVRHVTVRQGDRVILTLSASFHIDEPGPQTQTPMREVPPPPPADWIPDPAAATNNTYGVDLYQCPQPPLREAEVAVQTFWARTAKPMPSDRVLGACAAMYMSDLSTGSVVARALGFIVRKMDAADVPMIASLDHAMWFHRPVQADDWLLLDAVAMGNAGSTGLMRGTIHDRSGVHLATFAQEVLLRER
jgi:acyl-CoA thioesterase-2